MKGEMSPGVILGRVVRNGRSVISDLFLLVVVLVRSIPTEVLVPLIVFGLALAERLVTMRHMDGMLNWF